MRRRFGSLAAMAGFWIVLANSAPALDVFNYSREANDRFEIGFPSTQVANTDPSFVGLPYDWSGVGWASTDASKGFGFITPQHYLVARHYGGAATIQLVSPDGTLRAATEAAVTETTYGVIFEGQPVGDLSIGRLTAPMPASWQIARYGVLDLNASSTTNSSYTNQPLLAYGRGNGTESPRIGSATINGTTTSGLLMEVRSQYGFSAGQVRFVTGDSGSPTFIPWTNPDGGSELTIVGNNAGTNFSTINAYNLLASSTVIGAVNALTTPQGFALRVVGNTSATWQGGTGNPAERNWLARDGNWSSNSVPTDLYSRFNAAATTVRSLNVNAATNLRGLAFLSTAADDGFTFSGANSLTIGRGGITNYDNSRQTISAPIALGASQYWDVGAGGVTAGAIDTAGFLLEVAGSGTGIISSAVSGSGGGVALSGSRLEMSGTSGYTGGTWVHSGRLVVDGSIATSSGVTVNAAGSLAGSGLVAAITGSGSVDPGNSPGILTSPSVNPAGGLDFNFEFTQLGSPTWGDATASGNDVLRLESGTTPFTSSLTAANAINVYLDAGTLTLGSTFRGGFFTDRDADFLGSISNATFNYFLADGGGSVSYGGKTYDVYAGPFTFDWSTVAETANFAGGSEAGYVGQFVVVPEPPMWLLVAVAGVGGVAVRVRRRAAQTA